MKRLTVKFILLMAACPAFAQTLSFDPKIADNSGQAFVEHLGPQPGDTYMVMTVSYKPAENVRLQLESIIPEKLKNRGEAHVTVITPPEAAALTPFIAMKDLDQIAISMGIQDSALEPVCVGRGEAVLNGNKEHTYYIVVRAPNLLGIRKKIQELFLSRGGKAGDFVFDRFWPHITLGFTKRDLFEQDGVIKDDSSCVYKLNAATSP